MRLGHYDPEQTQKEFLIWCESERREAWALVSGPRNDQYNRGGRGIVDYFPNGATDIAFMGYLKAMRAQSASAYLDWLLDNNQPEYVIARAKETLLDSFRDLSNYAIFGAAFVQYWGDIREICSDQSHSDSGENAAKRGADGPQSHVEHAT